MSIVPDGGLALAVARFATVGSLLSAFGGLVFDAIAMPRVLARHPDAAPQAASIRLLARRSLLAALAGLLVWSVLQTADFAGSGTDLAALAANWPIVLRDTVFGHVLLAQALAAVAACLAWRRFPRLAFALTAAATLLQAGHSHAASMDGPGLLLASDVVHLAAAGAWLGGLVPLLIVVRDGSPRAGASAARWFSPLGKWCVALLVVSAAWQFWGLIGGLPGLVGTAYGVTALAKLALLGVLLGFAVLNRYHLAPALVRGDPVLARRTLLRSITVQTGFGLATVLAASVLSSLPPSLHEQPVWPFPLRPSLEAMAEPELAAEVWQGAAIAAAAAALIAALAWPRLRRAAAPVALAAAGLFYLAWPHLALLLVDAYPTSYFTSPTEFAASSIVQGDALYPANCASCHGASGQGDGPAAASLPVPPADLTATHLWAHSDGELFWWLSHGIEAPDGTPAMPGFAGTLTEDQRWALIDAIRARNAGTAWRDTGAWPVPVALPSFDLSCPTGATTTSALRGHTLYLVLGGGPLPPPATLPTISILIGADHPAPGPAAIWTGCTADAAVGPAVALLLGRSPAAAAGARFVVDANGWLRIAKLPPAATAWDNQATLSATIAGVATPLTRSSPGHHHG